MRGLLLTFVVLGTTSCAEGDTELPSPSPSPSDGGVFDVPPMLDASEPVDLGLTQPCSLPTDTTVCPRTFTNGCPGFVEDCCVFGREMPGCSLPTADDGCGYDLTAFNELFNLVPEQALCLDDQQPGAREEVQCPSATINGLQFVGCCRPEGFCGIFLRLDTANGPDMGCLPRETVSGLETLPCIF